MSDGGGDIDQFGTPRACDERRFKLAILLGDLDAASSRLRGLARGVCRRDHGVRVEATTLLAALEAGGELERPAGNDRNSPVTFTLRLLSVWELASRCTNVIQSNIAGVMLPSPSPAHRAD